MKTLFLNSPLMIYFLETTRYFGIKNLKVFLQLVPSDRIRRLEIGTTIRGFSVVDSHHCFNRTTCTHRHFYPEIHSPDPEVSEIKPSNRIQVVQLPFSGKSCFPPLDLVPPREH